MIVGCYDMHLYCRNEDAETFEPLPGRTEPAGPWHRYAEFPHQFTGRNERECKAAARRRGWRFSSGDATCPRCAKRA